MIRRFGQLPHGDQTYTHRPGAYVLLLRGDDLLLTHQAKPVSEFQLPGGGIDAGESPMAALYREVMEETGWSMSRPRRLGCFRRFAFMPDYNIYAEKLCSIYLATPIRQLAPPIEPHHTPVWMPKDQAARALGNSGDRHFAALLV